MATIKYKGMVIQSITECKVFEEPRKMLVWNPGYNGPIEKMVCAIIPYRHEGSVIATCAAYGYCAEIPEKHAPRRATNRELAKWLAHGNGEYILERTACMAEHYWNYEDGCEDEPANGHDSDNELKVRKWDDTEWHEPTVDYLGIEA